DLTDKISSSSLVDLNKFPQDLVDLYKSDGKNYAIPKDYDTVGLWYNKTLFDEAGISYPDETWTWDTLL
ncbi:ABC transporter, substrate-binding protein, partial [human gut metagenome]